MLGLLRKMTTLRWKPALSLASVCLLLILAVVYLLDFNRYSCLNPGILSQYSGNKRPIIGFSNPNNEFYVYYSNSNNIAKDGEAFSHCYAGHIPGMPPICSADGCLPTITSAPRKSEAMYRGLRSAIDSMDGMVSTSHVEVVQFLTNMQWSFGIYGSVGEIGVYHGKYAAMLAYNMALDLGERLFVCDIFGKEEHMKLKTELASIQRFEYNMNKVGFSIYTDNEAQRIRVFDDSSMYLSKLLYLRMGLPAFRFYSIDGSHHFPYVFNDLRHVACSLRKGGIISSDDILYKPWPEVLKAHVQFFTVFGNKTVKPLLYYSNKLYSCDVSYFSQYMEHIKEHPMEGFKKVTDNRFGQTFTYYYREE